MNNEELKEKIYIFSLENASKHNGNANKGAIIGKVIAIDPSLKDTISTWQPLIDESISLISSLTPEQIKEELKAKDKQRFENLSVKHKKDFNELPNAVMGKVVTRIPPEPSKYSHIGHALSFLINYIYAKKYQGRSILRFEDTNPGKSNWDYVNDCLASLEYIGITPDKTVYVSDDMEIFYDYAKKAIDTNKAYVCFCQKETISDLRAKGISCECSKASKEKNLSDWGKMKSGEYEEGKCTLRLRIDMKSNNFVMRDPSIFRIIKTPHYKQGTKYFAWPMYDFENSIEEHLCGITHVLRSNEFGSMRIELQDYIKDLFGLNKQTIIQYGRFNVEGATTQGREIREMIESGKLLGWDDPRLVTVKALKRRGIIKETFLELAKQVGLSPTPTNLNWTLISSANRKFLDASVPRFFLIKEPIKIKISNAPSEIIKIKKHPAKDMGERTFETNEDFIIEKSDFEKLEEGKIYRLIDCINFIKTKNGFEFHSKEYDKFPKDSIIIHWLPDNNSNIDVAVMMPDANKIKCVAENSIKSLKTNDIIQFARFGFCRLDNDDLDKMLFYYSHK